MLLPHARGRAAYEVVYGIASEASTGVATELVLLSLGQLTCPLCLDHFMS